MKKKITFTKETVREDAAFGVHVEIAADRGDALELLAIGVKDVMDCMEISMTEFLETLFEAREMTPISRTVTDLTALTRFEKEK